MIRWKSSGFTIVELLVVIVVIGILATITIVSYTGISQKAIISSITSDLDSAFKKFKLYQVENSGYPTGIELNCNTPVTSTNICLKPSPNNQYTLTAVDNSVVSNQTFCLTILNTALNTKYNVINDGTQSPGGCPTTLTIIAGTGGTVNTGGTYESGVIQTITATPNTYYVFSSWTGNTGCSGTASHTITMDASKTCTANFSIIPYNLTIIAGTGGTVNTGGIYDAGTSQTITATPINTFYSFSSWTGDTGCSGTASHTITMDANKSCTANFTLDPNWIAGVASTALAGKYVYHIDAPAGAYTWANRATGCPSEGRLPTISELQAIYDNRASYGNNFQGNNIWYWSSTVYSGSTAYIVNFSNGVTAHNGNPYYARCVAG